MQGLFTKWQGTRFCAHPGNVTIACPLPVSLSVNLGPDVCIFFLPGGCAGFGSSEMGTQGPFQQRPLRIWKSDRGLTHSRHCVVMPFSNPGLRYSLLVGCPTCRQQISPGI